MALPSTHTLKSAPASTVGKVSTVSSTVSQRAQFAVVRQATAVSVPAAAGVYSPPGVTLPALPPVKVQVLVAGFALSCRAGALRHSVSFGPATGTTGSTTVMLTRSVASQPNAST